MSFVTSRPPFLQVDPTYRDSVYSSLLDGRPPGEWGTVPAVFGGASTTPPWVKEVALRLASVLATPGRDAKGLSDQK